MEDGKDRRVGFFPILIVTFVLGIMVGYRASRWVHEGQVKREAKEQFYGFVVATDRLGLIDRKRLDELTDDCEGDAEDGASVSPESEDSPSCENPPPDEFGRRIPR